MPTDKHGVTHASSLGLFEDEDEHYATVERSGRHERKHLEPQIRRQERRKNRLQRREFRPAEREAKWNSKLPWPVSWLGKLFGGDKDLSPEPIPARPVGGTSKGGNSDLAKQIRVKKDYVVMRKPPTPQPVYTAEDIDPADSS
jgi:hypothetical protein